MDFDISKVVTQHSDDKIKCIGHYGYFSEDPDLLRKLVVDDRRWNNYGMILSEV